MRAWNWVLLAGLVGYGGCGDDGGSTPQSDANGAGDGAPGSADAMTPLDGGNPVGAMLHFEIEPFDVQPGTERQVCKVVNLPSDGSFDVVRFTSVMQGTSHHLNVYKGKGASETTPATAAEGMVHDCSPAEVQFDGSAAYIFGAAEPERILQTPPGVAFRLEPGHRLVLEQHVINYTDSVTQGGATLDLHAPAADAVIEHHAEMAWFAYWNIEIPPGQRSYTDHCTFPYPVEVFGLMSHTHQLGTHFTIDEWRGSVGDHLYDSYDWAHPVYMELATPLVFAAGEGLSWTCRYANPTGSTVMAGQNSTDEMCMTFAAYYPTATLDAEPTQCNEFFADAVE